MKKTLVALAAIASVSSYAQVTMSGIMDANYTSATAFGQSYNLVDQSGSRTTTVKLNGLEDVGGGTSVKFQFEVQPSIIAANGNAYNTAGSVVATTGAVTANGTTQTTGQASAQSGLVGKGYSYVGAAGNFGEVQLGTINLNSLYAAAASQAFGTGIGSGYKTGILADTTRVESAVAYFTPSFNGVQGRYTLGTQNDSQYGTTTALVLRRSKTAEFGLNYDQGPLSIKFANLKVTTDPNGAAATPSGAAGSNVTTTTNTLSAGYTIGAIKAQYVYQTQKNDAGLDTDSVDRHIDTKAQMLIGQYTMGATRLLLSKGTRNTNAGYATVTTTDTNLAGLKGTFTGYGVEYDLSKRTYVYFKGSTQNYNDINWTTLVVNGVTQTTSPTDKRVVISAVGLSHAF